MSIWLEDEVRSTSIRLIGGAPLSTSTSMIPLGVGSNNSIVISGYFTASNQTAILNLKLEICTAQGGGVCVYYPLQLIIRS